MQAEFSVLMSVYFREDPDYLDAALKSILLEQSLLPSQVVIVQDGELTEALYEVLDSWEKNFSRIITRVQLPANVGLASALNEGLGYCSYDIVARMDTDDIAIFNRFEKQFGFMIANKNISVCSGIIEEWNQDFSKKLSERKLPLAHNEILRFAKSRSPVSHPAVMFRKSDVLAVGGYPNIYPEDYPLWASMLNHGFVFANLPDVLLKMRVAAAIAERRGRDFLRGEIEVYNYMYKIGFIGRFELIRNISARRVLRLSPLGLKRFFYKYIR